MTKQLTQDDFKGLPLEIQCAAIDEDGLAFAYYCKKAELKLFEKQGYHFSNDCSYSFLGNGYDTTNWQNSAIDRE